FRDVAGDMNLRESPSGRKDQDALRGFTERKGLFTVGRDDFGNHEIPGSHDLVAQALLLRGSRRHNERQGDEAAKSNDFHVVPRGVARPCAASGIFRIAVEQLDRDALRPAQKADLYPGPGRMRLLGELDTLLPEIGRDCIDARNRKTEMVEALIRRDRCRIDTVTGIDLGQEDHGAAEADVQATPYPA